MLKLGDEDVGVRDINLSTLTFYIFQCKGDIFKKLNKIPLHVLLGDTIGNTFHYKVSRNGSKENP